MRWSYNFPAIVADVLHIYLAEHTPPLSTGHHPAKGILYHIFYTILFFSIFQCFFLKIHCLSSKFENAELLSALIEQCFQIEQAVSSDLR